jgi:DNA-binding transcriptional LysR family regulator
MSRQISWDEFRLVKAIADAQGLGGAADTLGLNHSTVFRRLNALEDDLGAQLFERGRNGYALTSSGEQMVALARRMAEEVVEFERKVAGRDLLPSGEVKVTTTDTILTCLTLKPFASFRQRYPDIKLDVNIENRALNLSHRDADVALRASNQPPESLVGRRIATIAWAVYAAKGMPGLPEKPREAQELALSYAGGWVGFGEPLHSNNGAKWLASHVRDDRIGIKVNGMLGVVEAVAAGLGVGLVPCFTAEERSDLVRVSPPVVEAASSLWLLTHPDLRGAARIRTFLDYMAGELAKVKYRIECTGSEA